jgi:hypothetical protein
MSKPENPTVSPDVAAELLFMLGQVSLSVNDPQFDQKVEMLRRAKTELEAFLPDEDESVTSRETRQSR